MTVPTRSYLALRTAMERRGVTVTTPWPSPTRRVVPADWWDALWQALAERGAGPEVILELAHALPVGAVNGLDLALVTAPTTGDALWLLPQAWPSFGSPGDTLEVRPVRAGVRVTVRHARQVTEDPQGDTFALAVVVTRLRSQARRLLVARAGGFPLSLAPASRVAFERFFGCPLERRREAFLEFDDAALRGRQLSADATAHRLLAEHLLRTGSRLPDEVMAEARRWLSRGAALDDVAHARGESPRTLQRRLAEVGLSWRAVRDAVRQDEAKLMLTQGRRSLPDIAEALGFSDQAVFSRAFSRWTGLSPSRYRRETATPSPTLRPGTRLR